MVRFALLRKKTNKLFSSASSFVKAPTVTNADDCQSPRAVENALMSVVSTSEAPQIPLPDPRVTLRTDSEQDLTKSVVTKVSAWRTRASENVESQVPLPYSSENDEGPRHENKAAEEEDLVSVLLQMALVVNFLDVSELRRFLSTLSNRECISMRRLCRTVISGCPWHSAGLGTDKNPEEVVSMFVEANQPKMAYLELPTYSSGMDSFHGSSGRRRHSVQSGGSVLSYQNDPPKTGFSSLFEGVLRNRRNSGSYSRDNPSGASVVAKSAFDDLRNPSGDCSAAAKLAFAKKHSLSNLSGKSKVSATMGRNDKRNTSSNSGHSSLMRSILWRFAETTTKIGDIEYGGDGCPRSSDEGTGSTGIYSRYAARNTDEEPRQSSQNAHGPVTSPRRMSGSVSCLCESSDGSCLFKYLTSVQSSLTAEIKPSFRRSMTSDTVNTSTLLDAVLHDVNTELLERNLPRESSNANPESAALLLKFRGENRKLRQANAVLARIASKTGGDTEAKAELFRSLASQTGDVTETRSLMANGMMSIPSITMELDEIIADTCESDQETSKSPSGSGACDAGDVVDGKMEKSSSETDRVSKWLLRREMKRAKKKSGKLNYGAVLRAEHEQTLDVDVFSDDGGNTETAEGGVNILPIITVQIAPNASQVDLGSETDEGDSDAEIRSVLSATENMASFGDSESQRRRSTPSSTTVSHAPQCCHTSTLSTACSSGVPGAIEGADKVGASHCSWTFLAP